MVLGTGSGELRHRPTGYWEELPFGAYLVGRAAARAIAVEQAWLQLSLWPSEIPPFVFRA